MKDFYNWLFGRDAGNHAYVSMSLAAFFVVFVFFPFIGSFIFWNPLPDFYIQGAARYSLLSAVWFSGLYFYWRKNKN